MDKKLRKRAEKKVEAKKAFYICMIVFSFVTIILLMLGYFIPAANPWLLIPIPVFIMVLSIIYISAFGWPGTDMDAGDWEEEEIQKEMMRMSTYVEEEERLELRELEELKDQDEQ